MLLATSCAAEMHARGCRVRAQRKCVRDTLARLVACTGTSNTLGCVVHRVFALEVLHASEPQQFIAVPTTQEVSRQYLSRERTGNGGPRQRRRRRRERDLRRGRRPDVEELVEDLGRRRLVERVVEAYKSSFNMLGHLEAKAAPLSRKDSSGFSAEVRRVLAYARDNRLE